MNKQCFENALKSKVFIYFIPIFKIIISNHVQQTCDFVAFALKRQ